MIYPFLLIDSFLVQHFCSECWHQKVSLANQQQLKHLWAYLKIFKWWFLVQNYPHLKIEIITTAVHTYVSIDTFDDTSLCWLSCLALQLLALVMLRHRHCVNCSNCYLWVYSAKDWILVNTLWPRSSIFYMWYYWKINLSVNLNLSLSLV